MKKPASGFKSWPNPVTKGKPPAAPTKKKPPLSKGGPIGAKDLSSMKESLK